MPPEPFVTYDDQLDALALIEAVANNDTDAERTLLRTYVDGGGVGGLVRGLTVIALVLANVGVAQGAWATASDALALARLGILDTTQAEEEK